MTARVLLVTGTGTGVGKTIATAAIAALASSTGQRIAAVKPAQTGSQPDDLGDLDEVRRLAGVTDLHELVRFPDALAPATAARLAGRPGLVMADAASAIHQLLDDHDLVIVEGAGGILVEFNGQGQTMADLALLVGAQALVVTEPELGTLNHTALTLEALQARGITCAGVIIGSWPNEPSLACRTNLDDLEQISGQPLAGVFEEQMGRLARPNFLRAARVGLSPDLGGLFDAAHFRKRFDYRRNL